MFLEHQITIIIVHHMTKKTEVMAAEHQRNKLQFKIY